MRISTGLEPVVKAWKVPDRSDPHARYVDPQATITLPTHGVSTVWIIEFCAPEDSQDYQRGAVVHAMLCKTEPRVEKKYISYSIVDEHPHKDDAEEYYRRKENAPDDAQKVVHHSPQMLTDIHLHWFEVTL